MHDMLSVRRLNPLSMVHVNEREKTVSLERTPYVYVRDTLVTKCRALSSVLTGSFAGCAMLHTKPWFAYATGKMRKKIINQDGCGSVFNSVDY